jgi:hypothetical protein
MFRPEHIDGGAPAPSGRSPVPSGFDVVRLLGRFRWALLCVAAAVTLAAGLTGKGLRIDPPPVRCQVALAPGVIAVPPVERYASAKQAYEADATGLAVRLGLRDPRADLRPCPPRK